MRHGVPFRADLLAAAAGATATVLASTWVVRVPEEQALLTLAGPVAFTAMAVAFAVRPHLAFATLIPFFVFTPALKVFVDVRIGALKDVIVAAVVVAAAATFVHRRLHRVRAVRDPVAVLLVSSLAALYVVNVGGHLSGESVYEVAWFHGVRLRLEPLVLFIAALVLPDPRRNLRYAAGSTIATACVVATYGLVQQILGPERLVDLGYEYGHEVRTIETQLRSFGTLDTPFTYAAFLALALGIALVGRLRPSVRFVSVAIIVAGLAAALVRTTAVIAVALLAVWLASKGRKQAAVFLAVVAAVAGLAVFVSLESRTTRTVQANPQLYLTFNGRTTVWQERLEGKYGAWLAGEGVGTTGTAATRAERSLLGDREESTGEGHIVDSGYFVTLLDVGVVGVALALLLFARIAAAAGRAVSRGDHAGWITIAVLVVTLFGALTAEAFTDFPFAYLTMLMLGLGHAASGAEPESAAGR